MRWLALVAMLAFILAGCSGKSGGTDAGVSDQATGDGGATQVVDGTTSTHGSNAVAGNHAPTGSMIVSATKGNAPLKVNFTLDGTDQDHDALSWTVDANGDGHADSKGTTLPARANFTYATPGLYKVTYKITDGKQDVSYPATVNVTSNVPHGAQAPITITGSITGAYLGAPAVGGVGYSNVDNHPFAVTSVAKNMTVHLEWAASGVDLDMYLAAPDGTSAGSSSSYNIPVDPSGTFAATEPDIVVTDEALLGQLGDWVVTIAPGEAVQTTYTVTITFA